MSKKPLTPEEQKEYLRRRQEGCEFVARLRAENLRGMPYCYEDVDAVLSLGDNYDGPPRLTSGLFEQQRLFMKMPDHPCNKQPKD